MADAQLNLTRRALLGAACVPLVIDASAAAGAAAPPLPGDDWAGAMAAFLAAQAAVAEIEAVTAGASFEEEEAWLPRHEAACERMEAAAAQIFALPAPDLAAFAAKLDLLFAHGVEPGAAEEGWIEAVRVDAARLLRGG